MITVFSNDINQINILENMLIENNLEYSVEYSKTSIGIGEPYLTVDGVPLDMGRAIKYIEGKKKE